MSIPPLNDFSAPLTYTSTEDFSEDGNLMTDETATGSRKRPLESTTEETELSSPPTKRSRPNSRIPNFFQQEINSESAEDILHKISAKKRLDFLLSCHPDHLSFFIPLCDDDLLIGAINMMSSPQRQAAFTSLSLEQQLDLIPDISPANLRDLCETYDDLQRGHEWGHQLRASLKVMKKEQVREILPLLSSKQIKASLKVFKSREMVNLLLNSTPSYRHKYFFGLMNPEQKDFACLILPPKIIKSYVDTLKFQQKEQIVGHLRNYSDNDFLELPLTPYELATALSDDVLSEKILGLLSEFSPELLRVAVPFIPADEFHDFVDTLSIHSLIPLLPFITPEQLNNGMSVIGETDILLMIRHLSEEQIRASISELYGQNLISSLNLMSTAQLKAAIEGMRVGQKDLITTPFRNLPFDNSDIVKEFISQLSPAELAVIMVEADIRDNLKNFLHMMTFEQIRISTSVIKARELIDFLQHLSNRMQRGIISSLSQETGEICQSYLNSSASVYLVKWKGLKKESLALESRFKQISNEIHNFDPEKEPLSKGQVLSGSLHKFLSKCFGLKKRVRDLLPKMGVLLTFAQSGWGNHPLKQRKDSISDIHKCVDEIRRLTQELNSSNSDSLACLLQLKLRRYQGERSHSPMFTEDEAVYADPDRTWELYNSVKESLDESGISAADIDSINVSWEEIIASGVKDADDITRLGILSAEDLQKHVQNFSNSDSEL